MASLPLFLSDIAGSEILLILLFILIFFGSKSIPGIARTMGRTIRQIKDASQEVQNEIKKSGGDIKGDFNLQRMVDDTVSDIEKPFREQAKAIDQNFDFTPPQSFVQPPLSSTKVDETKVPLDQSMDNASDTPA